MSDERNQPLSSAHSKASEPVRGSAAPGETAPTSRLLVLPQWSAGGDRTLSPFGRGLPQVLESRLSSLERENLRCRAVLFREKGSEDRALMLDEMVPDHEMAKLLASMQPDYVLHGAIVDPENSPSGTLEIEVSLSCPSPTDPGTAVNLLTRQIHAPRGELLAQLSDLLEDLAETLKLDLSPRDTKLLRDFTTESSEAFFAFLTALLAPADSEPREKALLLALNTDPGYQDAAVALAQILLRRGEHEEARKRLAECGEQRPTSPRLFYLLGLVSENLGDLDRARESFLQFQRLRPDSALALFHLGSVSLARGEFDLARDHLERYVEREPEQGLGWESLGISHWRLGDLGAATRCLQRSHELLPDEVRILANLGKIHAANGDLPSAQECLEKGLALDPSNASLLGSLALLHAESDPEKGVDLLQEALEGGDPSDGDRSRLWIELGWLHARQLDFAEAESALVKAESGAREDGIRDEASRRLEEIRDPRRRSDLTRRILHEKFFLGEGDEEEQAKRAVAPLEEFVAQNPENPEGHFLLGLAQRRSQALERAAEAYRQCLEFDGDHVDAMTELGVILGQMGQVDESLDWAQRAVEVEPNSAALICNVGAAHLRRGEFEEAEHYFREASDLDPDDPIIQNCFRALELRRSGGDVGLK